MASFESAQKSPGVYVIEQESEIKAIGGVGTSTAGFIGIKNIQEPPPRQASETFTANTSTDTFNLNHTNVTGLTPNPVSASKTLRKPTNYTLDTTDKKTITFLTKPADEVAIEVAYKTGGAAETPKNESFKGSNVGQGGKVAVADAVNDSSETVKLTVQRTATIEGGKLKLDKAVDAGFSFDISYTYTEQTARGQSASNLTPQLFTGFTEFKTQPQYGDFDGKNIGGELPPACSLWLFQQRRQPLLCGAHRRYQPAQGRG